MQMKLFQVIEQNAKFWHVLAYARNTRATLIVLVPKMILVNSGKVKWSLLFMKVKRFQVIEKNAKF